MSDSGRTPADNEVTVRLTRDELLVLQHAMAKATRRLHIDPESSGDAYNRGALDVYTRIEDKLEEARRSKVTKKIELSEREASLLCYAVACYSGQIGKPEQPGYSSEFHEELIRLYDKIKTARRGGK